MYATDVIWVILTVAEDGTMALTQQLSHLSELGAPPRLGDTNLNPFGPTSRQSSQTLFQVRPDKFCSSLNVKLLVKSYLLLCNVALAEDTISLSYMHFMVFHVALSDIISSLFVFRMLQVSTYTSDDIALNSKQRLKKR